jgi:hypothetical protein
MADYFRQRSPSMRWRRICVMPTKHDRQTRTSSDQWTIGQRPRTPHWPCIPKRLQRKLDCRTWVSYRACHPHPHTIAKLWRSMRKFWSWSSAMNGPI